jgi:hypothetical protein
MIDRIREQLHLTSLKYQNLDDSGSGHRPAQGTAVHALLGCL